MILVQFVKDFTCFNFFAQFVSGEYNWNSDILNYPLCNTGHIPIEIPFVLTFGKLTSHDYKLLDLLFNQLFSCQRRDAVSLRTEQVLNVFNGPVVTIIASLSLLRDKILRYNKVASQADS